MLQLIHTKPVKKKRRWKKHVFHFCVWIVMWMIVYAILIHLGWQVNFIVTLAMVSGCILQMVSDSLRRWLEI